MKIYNGSSTESCKCSICGKATGAYYVYAYVDGIEIKVPMCTPCMEKRSHKFYDNLKRIMDARLKQIKADIETEKEISF